MNEYTERKDMSSDVVCMALASVPLGEQRSRFLAVGLADNTVRIISLDPNVSSWHLILIGSVIYMYNFLGLLDSFELASFA